MFPGQGSQSPGMLVTVPSERLARVKELTGIDLCDQDYSDAVKTQLAILTLQLWQVDRLRAQGFNPTVVGGHSLGVFAAAYAAGIYQAADLIKIVQRRAELMTKGYSNTDGYGLGVVLGLTRAEVEGLVSQVNSTAYPVAASNQNAPLQTALSGKLSAIKRVLKLANQAGANKALVLAVPTLSHSPLMAPVARHLSTYLDQFPANRPQCLYLANYDGHLKRSLAEIKYDLGHNLAHPVFWDTMLDVACELDLQVAVEMSPGTVLSKLLSQKNDSIRRIPLARYGIDDSCYLLTKFTKKTS